MIARISLVLMLVIAAVISCRANNSLQAQLDGLALSPTTTSGAFLEILPAGRRESNGVNVQWRENYPAEGQASTSLTVSFALARKDPVYAWASSDLTTLLKGCAAQPIAASDVPLSIRETRDGVRFNIEHKEAVWFKWVDVDFGLRCEAQAGSSMLASDRGLKVHVPYVAVVWDRSLDGSDNEEQVDTDDESSEDRVSTIIDGVPKAWVVEKMGRAPDRDSTKLGNYSTIRREWLGTSPSFYRADNDNAPFSDRVEVQEVDFAARDTSQRPATQVILIRLGIARGVLWTSVSLFLIIVVAGVAFGRRNGSERTILQPHPERSHENQPLRRD